TPPRGRAAIRPRAGGGRARAAPPGAAAPVARPPPASRSPARGSALREPQARLPRSRDERQAREHAVQPPLRRLVAGELRVIAAAHQAGHRGLFVVAPPVPFGGIAVGQED